METQKEQVIDGRAPEATTTTAAAVVLQKFCRVFIARTRFGDVMFETYIAEETEREERERRRMEESLSILDNLKLRQAMNRRFEDMLGDKVSKGSHSFAMATSVVDDEDVLVELPPLTSDALRKASAAMAPEMEEYSHVYTPHQLPFTIDRTTTAPPIPFPLDDQGGTASALATTPAPAPPPVPGSFETQMVPVDPTTISLDNVTKMHTNELEELASYLSGLTKTRFQTLLSELERREQLQSERELRYMMIEAVLKRLNPATT